MGENRRMRTPLLFSLVSTLAIACGGDDGGGGDGDGDVTPTAYRITSLNLRDPHTFALGSLDVTDMVDGLIADGITMDADDPPDGNLDLSITVVMLPLDQAGGSTPMQVVFADCTAPQSSTECAPDPDTAPVDSTATNDPSDPCLDLLPDTTSDYNPPVSLPGAPCFSSDAEAFNVALGDIDLAMEDARIAATYDADPATRLTGLIRGFVSQATADAALIPDDVAVVGGQPISSLLVDGDKDTGPNGGDGWYFYLNFVADEVPYTP